MKAIRLRTEYLKKPLGIDIAAPSMRKSVFHSR